MKSCPVNRPRLALPDQCLWHTGQHAGILACQYLIAVEIAPISQNSDLLVSCRLLRPECHRYELCSIMAQISHLLRHDQVVLDVDGGLHIVTDDAAALPLVAIARASGSV